MKQGIVLLLVFIVTHAKIINNRPVSDASSNLDSRWKLLGKGVCYQAKGDLPGKVEINQNGVLVAVKLVYVSGQIKCRVTFTGSYFGCIDDQSFFNLAITDKTKMVLFPPPNHALTYVDGSKNYKYPGYLASDKEVVFTNYDYPTYFKAGEYISIWNYEDLLNVWDIDNTGQVCVDVYGAFV